VSGILKRASNGGRIVLVLPRPDRHQIRYAIGVLRSPCRKSVLFTEGGVFALDLLPLLLWRDDSR